MPIPLCPEGGQDDVTMTCCNTDHCNTASRGRTVNHTLLAGALIALVVQYLQ